MFAPPLQKARSRPEAGGHLAPRPWPLPVGRRGDAAEREADRAAAIVLQPFQVLGARSLIPLTSDRRSQETSPTSAEAPDIVRHVLQRPGQPLDRETREYFEPRFGRDFSSIRVHSDGAAAQSAQAVGAHAYTVGRDIVLGRGVGGWPASRRLMAHELAHAACHDERGGDAREQVLRRYPDEAGPVDAGVPAIAGVPEPDPPSKIGDARLFQEYADALAKGDAARAAELDAEMSRRLADEDPQGWGTAAPRGPQPVTGGGGAITPEVGLKILDNMSRGEPPFKPAEGRGGCSWFTTEGNPYTAVTANKSVNVQVEIAKPGKPLTFGEGELTKIFEGEMSAAQAKVEGQVRAKYNVPEGAGLSNRMVKEIQRNARRLAESRMWTKVGEMVASSAERAGEVILEPGSKFSHQPGKFAVIADASKIGLKGGVEPLVQALAKQGLAAESTVVKAAEALATKMKWAGRVRTAFRYGGRLLIVVAVAADAYAIYRAQDKLKAVISSAGGWAGALAMGGAFAAWFAPADVAGPLAWVGHGVGTLVAGGVGYFIGSETTSYIYELVAE